MVSTLTYYSRYSLACNIFMCIEGLLARLRVPSLSALPCSHISEITVFQHPIKKKTLTYIVINWKNPKNP